MWVGTRLSLVSFEARHWTGESKEPRSQGRFHHTRERSSHLHDPSIVLKSRVRGLALWITRALERFEGLAL